MGALIGLRRRLYTEDQRLGELARDADDALRNASQAIRDLEARMAELEASGGGGGGSVSYGTPGTIEPDDSVADGVATTVARSDHQHGIAAAAAGAATPGDTVAEGSASSFARSDHRHSLPAFGTGAGTFCQGNDARLSDARAPTAHKTSHQFGGSDAIKLDDLAAPDDNTDLDASTAAHGLMRKYPGGTSTFLRADGSFAAPPGASGDVARTWLPDLAPVSPHAHDDEFDNGSVSGSWSTWDPAGYVTVTEGDEGIKFAGTGNATNRWAGKYKAVPASEFSVIAKLMVPGVAGANGTAIALFVAMDLAAAPATADFRQIENLIVLSATSAAVISRTWNAYNGSTSVSTITNPTPTALYVRLRVNGTAMATDYCYDGKWWKAHSTATLGFTPVHYGLSFLQNDAVAGEAYCRFFRVASGAGTSVFNAQTTGRYVSLYFSG